MRTKDQLLNTGVNLFERNIGYMVQDIKVSENLVCGKTNVSLGRIAGQYRLSKE